MLKSKITSETIAKVKELNNSGKTSFEIMKALSVSQSSMNQIRKKLSQTNDWVYHSPWKTIRLKSKAKVKTPKSIVVKESRKTKAIQVLNINFKGINVEIQNSSNIIITENTIYVK